jgi:hypothetical protein
MSTASKSWFWLAMDSDGELAGVGVTVEDARRNAIAEHTLNEAAVAAKLGQGMTQAEIAEWADSLTVGRVELHGPPIFVRALTMRLALDVPGVLFLPSVRVALDASEAARAA